MVEPPDLTAQLDQYGAMLAGLASIIGQYRRALVREGVPDQEAAQLVRDWHWLQHCRINWPAEPPEGGPWDV